MDTNTPNQQSASFSRDMNGQNPQATQQQQMVQDQTMQQQAQPQDQPQQFVPYAAFPATQPRDYDMNIKNMIAGLVDRLYGAEINPQAREFEIARVYNKLEIEIFEMSTFQLSKDKQEELRIMTENSQNNPGANSQEMILKIREYMQNNVPNISDMVNQYMVGFRNQYLAGRY